MRVLRHVLKRCRAGLLATTLSVAVGSAAAASLQFDDALFELKAQARACYLGFIHLYDVGYYAREDAGRCVQVSYLRDFSQQALDEATFKVFAQRHGDDAVERYRQELQQLAAAYRAVEPGDRYTYCVTADADGVLLRDGEAVVRVDSDGFAERFLQIWVRSDRPSGEPEWAFGQC